MVKLRVAARVIPENSYLASLDAPSSNAALIGERRFPVIVRDPEEWYIGTLALEIKQRYQSLYKHDLGKIKYLKDNEDDCDLDPELSVYDLLIDEGKAATTVSDQHVTIKVIQEQGRAIRAGSVIPDLTPIHFQPPQRPPVPTFNATSSSLGKRATGYASHDGRNATDFGNKKLRLAEIQETQEDRPLPSIESESADTILDTLPRAFGSPILVQDSQTPAILANQSLLVMNGSTDVANEEESSASDSDEQMNDQLEDPTVPYDLPRTDQIDDQRTSTSESRPPGGLRTGLQVHAKSLSVSSSGYVSPHASDRELSRKLTKLNHRSSSSAYRGPLQLFDLSNTSSSKGGSDQNQVPITPPSDFPVDGTTAGGSFPTNIVSKLTLPGGLGSSVSSRKFKSYPQQENEDVFSEIDDSQMSPRSKNSKIGKSLGNSKGQLMSSSSNALRPNTLPSDLKWLVNGGSTAQQHAEGGADQDCEELQETTRPEPKPWTKIARKEGLALSNIESGNERNEKILPDVDSQTKKSDESPPNFPKRGRRRYKRVPGYTTIPQLGGSIATKGKQLREYNSNPYKETKEPRLSDSSLKNAKRSTRKSLPSSFGGEDESSTSETFFPNKRQTVTVEIPATRTDSWDNTPILDSPGEQLTEQLQESAGFQETTGKAVEEGASVADVQTTSEGSLSIPDSKRADSIRSANGVEIESAVIDTDMAQPPKSTKQKAMRVTRKATSTQLSTAKKDKPQEAASPAREPETPNHDFSKLPGKTQRAPRRTNKKAPTVQVEDVDVDDAHEQSAGKRNKNRDALDSKPDISSATETSSVVPTVKEDTLIIPTGWSLEQYLERKKTQALKPILPKQNHLSNVTWDEIRARVALSEEASSRKAESPEIRQKEEIVDKRTRPGKLTSRNTTNARSKLSPASGPVSEIKAKSTRAGKVTDDPNFPKPLMKGTEAALRSVAASDMAGNTSTLNPHIRQLKAKLKEAAERESREKLKVTQSPSAKTIKLRLEEGDDDEDDESTDSEDESETQNPSLSKKVAALATGRPDPTIRDVTPSSDGDNDEDSD